MLLKWVVKCIEVSRDHWTDDYDNNYFLRDWSTVFKTSLSSSSLAALSHPLRIIGRPFGWSHIFQLVRILTFNVEYRPPSGRILFNNFV